MTILTEQKRLGWMSMRDLAKLLGINGNTLFGRVNKGIFPAPRSRMAGGRRYYYDPIQVAEILRDYTEEEAK